MIKVYNIVCSFLFLFMSTRRLNTELDFTMLQRIITEGWVMSQLGAPAKDTFVLQNLDGHERLWFDGGAFTKRLQEIGRLQHGGLKEIRPTTP
jgi:hypothetical protein